MMEAWESSVEHCTLLFSEHKLNVHDVSATLIEMYLDLSLMTYFHNGSWESVVHCTTIQWSELNVSVSLIEMYLGLSL